MCSSYIYRYMSLTVCTTFVFGTGNNIKPAATLFLQHGFIGCFLSVYCMCFPCLMKVPHFTAKKKKRGLLCTRKSDINLQVIVCGAISARTSASYILISCLLTRAHQISTSQLVKIINCQRERLFLRVHSWKTMAEGNFPRCC